MARVVIENPVVNSPFEEPKRHFRFDNEGITSEIVSARRTSHYFIPIPRPRKRGTQAGLFETEWLEERIQENRFINQVRERVARWRTGGHVDVTKTTARLLDHWSRDDRERRLFFCQIEAVETIVYLTEVAKRYGDAWIENDLRRVAAEAGWDLYRAALKMATGSGKTVVMAMLIAWHTLNKLANPQDARFSGAFLVVTPGITIRDRLRVLLPSDPSNYYRQHDLVPLDLLPELGRAKIVITNFHAFKLKERMSAGKLTKALLKQGELSPFTETPDQMVRRVCRELGGKRIARREVEEFKAEVQRRFPGRDTAELTDEDLLREVLNTVGKPGKLGEHVKWAFVENSDPWDVRSTILGSLAAGGVA